MKKIQNLTLKTQNSFTHSPIHSSTSRLSHPFEPIIFENSEILILGSFPSIKSFKNEFYYGHPQNQFWKILGIIFNKTPPKSIEEKIAFLKKHKIALWDAICECKRENGNSRDDNLKNIKPCPIDKLLKIYPNIKQIAVTSRLAQKIIKKHFPFYIEHFPFIYLPSPSPLNARMNLEKKANEWKKLLQLT